MFSEFDVPPGYSFSEWSMLAANTRQAIAEGGKPPSVRIHASDGSLVCLMRYENGLWGVDHSVADPSPVRPHVCPEPKRSQVYFIGTADGPIKIGEAGNPAARLRSLQTGSPAPLLLLAVSEGGPVREREYHRQFAAHRLHGEWFTRCPEIEAEIARLSTNAEGSSNG